MKNKWLSLVVLGLILILAVPALTGCVSTTAAESTPQVEVSQQLQGIWVSGTGELSVAPDIATLSLGVVAQEMNVAQAQLQASEAMAKVMQALSDSKIDPKDIQTGYFSINQRSRWNEEKQSEVPTGYQVTNMVTVKVRETEKAGAIIDAVVLAGGDFIRINGIDFTVEEPSKYYKEVREMAMNAAKNKAEQLATLAGLTLGKATYIAENAQYTPSYRAYSNVSAAVPMPEMSYGSSISTGQTKITLNVEVAYATTP